MGFLFRNLRPSYKIVFELNKKN